MKISLVIVIPFIVSEAYALTAGRAIGSTAYPTLSKSSEKEPVHVLAMEGASRSTKKESAAMGHKKNGKSKLIRHPIEQRSEPKPLSVMEGLLGKSHLVSNNSFLADIIGGAAEERVPLSKEAEYEEEEPAIDYGYKSSSDVPIERTVQGTRKVHLKKGASLKSPKKPSRLSSPRKSIMNKTEESAFTPLVSKKSLSAQEQLAKLEGLVSTLQNNISALKEVIGES
ncbi:uncharacterized protein NEMAJ01_1673 [Nematocida major]|uniref:uncharacterized protein n=1 Tax=Nematocida major TaxID=1912982 RepID=UPI0020082024|nr:uncharacterized protein NEMAJ01_1673 [Nematocida major]KAH9386777.1 hypothetical protein NEMAJ01_1673 [Nematocida major]